MAGKASILLSILMILNLQLSYGNRNAQAMKNCCFMKNGKMLICNGGITSKMNKSILLKNGTQCMQNGDYVLADGRSFKLKEGQCIDMYGHVNYCTSSKAMNRKKKGKTIVVLRRNSSSTA